MVLTYNKMVSMNEISLNQISFNNNRNSQNVRVKLIKSSYGVTEQVGTNIISCTNIAFRFSIRMFMKECYFPCTK